MSKRDVVTAAIVTEEEEGPRKLLKAENGPAKQVENGFENENGHENGDSANEWSVTRGPQIIHMGSKSCSHEVAWPGRVTEDKAFHAPSKSDKPPAKTYPFSVDPFQQVAINCLEAGMLQKIHS